MALVMASSRTLEEFSVDNLSNVYVADSGNGRIQKFSSSGVFLAKWGSSGVNDGQFNFSQGVAVDNSEMSMFLIREIAVFRSSVHQECF